MAVKLSLFYLFELVVFKIQGCVACGYVGFNDVFMLYVV